MWCTHKNIRSDYIRNKITNKTVITLCVVLTFVNVTILTGLETIESTTTIHSKTETSASATNEAKNNVATSKIENTNLENEPPKVEKTTLVEPNVIDTPSYTKEDLDLLSRLIYAEAGCSWFSDYHQLAVATVVMNRRDSSLFPNTIHDVIYSKGQYSCVSNGSINNTPDERTINNAKKILEGHRAFPSHVIFQSAEIQGKVYDSVYDKTLNTTTYFCY